MKWFTLVSQLLMQYSVQQRQIQEAPEKIKGMTVQAGVYLIGLIFLIAFTLASIVMIFVNLGQQWDSDTPAHLNGTITAAILLFAVGVIAVTLSALLARYLAKQKDAKPPVALGGASGMGSSATSTPASNCEAHTQAQAPGANAPINPLMLFGEEFLKQLIISLGRPKE